MLRYGETQKIIERRGFSLLDMKRYTAQLGYRSAGFKAEFSDLTTLEHPGIVPIKYAGFDHFVVLKSIHTGHVRSEEHTSELQSLMRISYAVFCLKKKKT